MRGFTNKLRTFAADIQFKYVYLWRDQSEKPPC